MNLLEKANIITTATAYDNGKLHSVKGGEVADFDVVRGSAATRVTAQGLVENVQILSSNLVQNGDFSEEGAEEVSNGSFSQEGVQLITNGSFDTDTKWTTNTGWSISGGSANCDGTQSGNTTLVQQNGIKGAIIDFVVGKTYKVNFDVVVTSGVITQLEVASGIDGNDITTSGNHTTYITAVSTNDRFTITANPDFVGSIDNVSVREVGQDWELQNGWSIGNDVAVFSGTVSAYRTIYQQSILTIGKTYKLTFDIVSISSGSIENISQSNPTSYNTQGTITEYFTASNIDLFLKPTTDADCSITNISVKEVGMDWEFNSTAILTANGMNITTGGFIRQDVVTIGKSYKLTYDIVSYTSGEIRVYDGTSQGSIPTSVGSNTFNFTAGGSVFYIQSNSVNVNLVITNISVIEITDDTNLPRINYEGFSYQDALGSELVTNGGFDDGLNGWSPHAGSTLELENGMAKVTTAGGSGFIKRTDLSIETGKTYFCKAYITNGLSPQWFINSVNNPINLSLISENTYGGYVTTNGNNPFFYIRGNNTDGEVSYIDNVSVKEYLGQEVVPDSGCGSWLFEPQSTNLVTDSEDYSQWTPTGVSVTSNSTTSPDGLINGTLLSTNGGTSNRYIRNFGLPTSATVKVLSVYAKANLSNFIQLVHSGDGQGYVNFDVSNGIVGTSGTKTIGEIQSVGNGWYRCIAYFDITNVFGASSFVALTTSNSVGYGGGATSDDLNVYIWGSQYEENNISSYIPTSGAIATRLADSVTGAGDATTFNSTEGVLYLEASRLSDLGTCQIGLFGSSSNEQIRIEFNNSSIRAQLYNGSYQVNMNSSQTVTNNNKIAFKYKENDFALWINGAEVLTDISGVTFNADELIKFNLSNRTGALPFLGKVKALAVFNEALTDSELLCLTTI